MTETAKDFRSLKAELDAMKAAYLGGKVSYDTLSAKAKETAAAYNETARAIAKKFNRRPKLITHTSLLR